MTTPPHEPHQDRCHLADQRFVPLAAEIRDTREALIGLRADMAHVRTTVDGLDRLVRGNGMGGLATQVQVHAQRLEALDDRVEAHEVEDRQEHTAALVWKRGLLTAILVCLLGWVLTTAVTWHRIATATPPTSPTPTAIVAPDRAAPVRP